MAIYHHYDDDVYRLGSGGGGEGGMAMQSTISTTLIKDQSLMSVMCQAFVCLCRCIDGHHSRDNDEISLAAEG